MHLSVLAFALAFPAHAGVVRAPVEIGRPGISAPLGSPMPTLPSYLSVANPEDRIVLAEIVHAAQASPTAVAVLAQVARTAEASGRPVVIEVLNMKESGTYNLDWGILSLRRQDMKNGPHTNVSTLIHELQHLLQTQRALPSDLLETELESYLLDFRVGREMGDTPRRGSYDERAQAAFKRGFEPFMEFLAKEYPEDSPMWKTRSRAYAARLRKGLSASEAKLDSLAKSRVERLRVLEQMRGLGHLEPELRNYRQDSIGPLDAMIETMTRAVEWARKDLAILADPVTRDQARAYARSVVRRARAYQKIFARD